MIPPVDRWILTRSVMLAEPGKPVGLSARHRESFSQGKPMALQVKEDEKSKGQLVMSWIEVRYLTAKAG